MDLTTERPPAPEHSLAALISDERVPWTTLEQRYGPLLGLVELLIGVVPNCDRYLEIWEPAFRTYNVLVPNFLNLPASVLGLGGAPADLVGLGMYVASRTAECPYCAAHTCSFALRRGATADAVTAALSGDDSSLSDAQRACAAVARSLAEVPATLTPATRQDLEHRVGSAEAEWVMLGIAMMGFLNKFMDALGVELEPSTVAEVSSTMGSDWSVGRAGENLGTVIPTAPPPADRLVTKLKVLPLAPQALRLDRRWQRGVPRSWPAVGTYLRDRTGHDFPVLRQLSHARPIQATATMLTLQLDAATTVVGLRTKVLAGLVFAEVVDDPHVRDDLLALAAHHGIDGAAVAAVTRFAADPYLDAPTDDPAEQAVLALARAASPSPARTGAEVVDACRQGGLTAPAIVEVVCWLSVLQMLHRLTSYCAAEA